MKKILLFIVFFGVRLCSAQETKLLWMQQPALSPDGKWIAFEYKGNLFKVSSLGGEAKPLTFNNAYNGYPVWSHDSKKIAFSSDRYGNFDVFIMPSVGGEAVRLTFDSAKDIPYDYSADNLQVAFGTDRHDQAASVRFPLDNLWMKLYMVSAAGGRSWQINSAGTEFLHYNRSGTKFIFQDRKGYEDPWRKHHISSVTRDIWVYDIKSKHYTKVSDFEGEDREPVWGNDQDFYYLSERAGTQNLFKSTLDHPTVVKQLTNFSKNPVRNLTRSESGMLAFTQNGGLYTLQEGQEVTEIKVWLAVDFNMSQTRSFAIKNGASEMAVSPNNKEVAFVYRGEIFVAAINGSGTKRITNTPYQERMVQFSPDGRSLLFSAENQGTWKIYQAKIINTDEPYFYASTGIKTDEIIGSTKDVFKGEFSPDGNSIAYLEERNVLKVFNLLTKKTTTITPEGMNYSYTDGDQYFSWSPDSKSLLISSHEGYPGHVNIVLVSADNGTNKINLTQTGFDADQPQWGMAGKMMYYLSGRNGLKVLSQGQEQSDVFATFFDSSAFDSFKLTKDEFALKNDIIKADTLTKSRSGLNKSTGSIKLLNPSAIDREKLKERTLRLTANSAEIADTKLSSDGEKLYYLAKYDGNFDLWISNLRTHETRLLTKLNAKEVSIMLSQDGKTLFVLQDGEMARIDPESGNKNGIPFNANMELNTANERSYLFEHAYAFLPKKFFDPNLQGTDWKYYHDQYARFLPHINNNYDFQLLLSEFLGELNSSHTGARYSPSFPDKDETACLGLIYINGYMADGLFVADVLPGGPFDYSGTNMTKGDIVDKIDDLEINGKQDWAILLNHKAGKYVQISFHDPKTNIRYKETIKPITARLETGTLLYQQWVKRMERLTDSLSGGKVGYVHIKSMNEESLRNTIDVIYGKNQEKKALIIDTRFNPGGNLHNELTDMISKKTKLTARPQGHSYLYDGLPDGSMKPSCVLMSEGNYSDGYNFPYQYKRLGLGKLIGAPVAGTGTGVYWENQIDNTLTIGIPELGLTWIGENTLLENHQLEPDVKVYNQYEQVLEGHDQQLETAVREMLKAIVKN